MNIDLPPHLLGFLADKACTHNESVEEILCILLRKNAEYLGHSCHHLNVTHCNGKHSCKSCGAKLEEITPPICRNGNVIEPGKYKSTNTFMDSNVVGA